MAKPPAKRQASKGDGSASAAASGGKNNNNNNKRSKNNGEEGTKKNKKAKTSTGKPTKPVPNIAGNKALREHIKKGIKAKCWPIYKFYPNNADHLYQFAKQALKGAELWGTDPYAPLRDKAALVHWVDKNSSKLAGIFNSNRQYVVSGLKKKFHAKILAGTAANLPTQKKILGCATRDKKVINLEKEEDFKIYDWYVSVLLPQVPGEASVWNKNVRLYQTISEAFVDDKKKLHRITAEHEAFTVLTYENYFSAWKELYVVKVAHPSKKQSHVSKATDKDGKEVAGVTDFHVPDEENIQLIHKKYSGKWTNHMGGSDQTNGWTAEGMKRYSDIYELVRASRANKEAASAFEKKYLAKKRQSLGITEATKAETDLKEKVSKSNETVHSAWLPELLGDTTDEEADKSDNDQVDDEENAEDDGTGDE
jgi:hypothetical protein